MKRLRSFLSNLVIAPVETAIEIISYPIWIADWIKRSKTAQRLLLYYAVSSALIVYFLSIDAWVTAMIVAGQMALQMVMMIGQFVVLFTFLSSTKSVEIYPGQEGMFTFEKDYYGNPVLVETIRQWIASLGPEGKAFLDEMGAEAIHGIMLEGEPGTGKTLLAQCLASESNAAFFGTSGTDYQAMFVGVGPMKIRSMYSKARKAAQQYGAAIVFIDEIDAIGGNRGGVSGSGNSGGGGGMFGGGGLGVLSKLLTELDGTKDEPRRLIIVNILRGIVGLPKISPGNVLTVGATNRLPACDPALLRPGRIDKIIQVPAPDKASRKAIIEGYLGKVRHDPNDIDIIGMVEDTAGVTPAQLASSIQRSAPRYAMNEGRLWLTQADIDQALQEDIVGIANPIQDWDPDQMKSTAIHEAGHAIVAIVVREDKRITTVSIVRRGGGILGYVRDVDTKEIFAMPLSVISANLMVSLAGYYAVSEIMGEGWSGAVGGDFINVRHYLKALALNGRFGGIPFQLGGPMNDDPFVSDRIKARADEYLQEAIIGTKVLINERREEIELIANELIERGELTSRDFYGIIKEYRERKDDGTGSITPTS